MQKRSFRLISASIVSDIANALVKNTVQLIQDINDPYYNNIILCSAANRLTLQKVFERSLPSVRVISYDELSRNVRLVILGQL